MKKYILSAIVFLFLFLFFTSESKLNKNIKNELNQEKTQFQFYKKIYPYVSDIIIIKILYYCHEYN